MSANTAAIGLPVAGLETPALCLDLDVYRRNVARMADFIIRRHGLGWRPHMKGQKAPQLALEAIRAGAAGVTCATVYETEAMVEAGVQDVLLANQVAGERKLARLAALERRARVITATDSLLHAGQLNAAALAAQVAIPVLVEVEVGMGRCGVTPDAAAGLAAAIRALPGLRFLGVMAWEGHTLAFEGADKQSEIERAIGALLRAAEQCRAAGIPVEIVSASGSGTFLMSAPLPGLTEVQAGGGVFSDLNYQRWGLDHEFALTVLSRVVSRPTPTRIIVDAGFKALSFQHGYPCAKGVGPLKSTVLTAEHGILELESPDAARRVGDLITFIPGYTDSTVCLHDEMCVVRNGLLEAVWAIPGRTGHR